MKDARDLYDAPGMATSAIIQIRDTDDNELLATQAKD